MEPRSCPWRSATRHAAPPVATTSAFDAFDDVLDGAGNDKSLDCDGTFRARCHRVDERVLGEVLQGTGRLSDDPSEVGGWPTCESGPACPHADGDGMPDAFEMRMGLDVGGSDANGDPDGDRTTDLEENLDGELATSLAGGSCPVGSADADRDGVCGDADNCPWLANANPSDADAGGAGDVCDCAATDAAAFAMPPEVRNVRLLADRTIIEWDPLALDAGSGTVHDVVRGDLAQVANVGSRGSETCLEAGPPDATAQDAPNPSPGAAAYSICP